MNSLSIAFLLLTAPGPGSIDFDTEVMPIFSKAGCNAADCHGSAAGRGGFHLSLFGGDPQSDHHAIVHQLVLLSKVIDVDLSLRVVGGYVLCNGKSVPVRFAAIDVFCSWQ